MDKCSEIWLNLEDEEMPTFGEDYLYEPPSFEFFKLGYRKALEMVLDEGIDGWLEDTIKEELKDDR